MKRASTLAILLLTVVPVCAQPQKSTIKATKTDAEKVVKVIGADKAKTQSYCDMAKLGEQIDEADQKKDQKKVEDLSQQMDAMSEKLGPEFISLMNRMQEMDPSSKEGQEITATLEGLDKLCAR